MTTGSKKSDRDIGKALPRKILVLLKSLRRKIRSYVVLEGLAIAVITVVVAFWLTLALDYFPVLAGFNELSRPLRVLILLAVLGAVIWVIYRFVLSRLFVQFRFRNMALLVERKYPEFDESLLTTVEQAARDVGNAEQADTTELLAVTREKAESLVSKVDVSQILNLAPLHRLVVMAGLLLFTIVGFALSQPGSFSLAVRRICLLDQETWPRRQQIEMVGVKVQRDNMIEGIEEFGKIQAFKEDAIRVARGTSLTLFVRAKVDSGEAGGTSELKSFKGPGTCWLNYKTDEGERGSQSLKKIGVARDGYQMFTMDSQPLRGILGNVSFTVRGGDHRIGPFRVEIVDAPTIIQAKLGCEFPEYMVDRKSGRWTPRDEVWTGRAELPQGTRVQIKADSNKPLAKVYVYDANEKSMRSMDVDGSGFELPIDLQQPTNLQFYLCDQDGIIAEQPFPVSIEPIEDQPPRVETMLQGIGTAITPNAMLPILGVVKDEYGLGKTWVEIQTPVTDEIVQQIQVGGEGKLKSSIDFLKWKQRSENGFELPVGGESSVSLVVKSQDRFDLADSPNLGVGDRYVLDVVSAGSLLRILERLEVGQRRRLEQIYSELVDARDYLVRSKSRLQTVDDGAEPGDDPEKLTEPEEPSAKEEGESLNRSELRLLFAERAILQVDKSTQEIKGVSDAFENIRLQLINNRVDSEDRRKRLSEQIVAPLRLIARDSLQQLRDDVAELELKLRELQSLPSDRELSDAADRQSVVAIQQADLVLSQVDSVLSILVKYETQNELLDLVRQMIKQQEEVMKRTKKERQKQAFEGLLDDE